MNLSQYVRIGRFDLPEPTRVAAPENNLLAQEASGITYNWDTDTLFVVADGGTAIVEISKTGELLSTMTLAQGDSPQGTEFYDPEGITYIGNGRFVMVEERDRNVVEFGYAADTVLDRDDAQTVNIGSNVGNVGLEGLSFDPLTDGFIFVKEKTPLGVFQSNIDFAAGTSSNGTPTTEPVDLFDPATLGVIDFADVFALSNVPLYAGTDREDNLLILSHESAQILEVDRATGTIVGTLAIQSDPDNPLDVVSQQHEGITMDRDGNIYVVSENGGGNADTPQLWVYQLSDVPNAAPTGITIANPVDTIDENTGTSTRVRVGDVLIADDGLGMNDLAVTGADAEFFEVDSTGLYLRAGTVLDFESKASYAVTVTVDDTSIGATPDASTDFTLTINDIVDEGAGPTLFISEIAPWSSGNSPIGADWFEVTNSGNAAIDITGWSMDDSSAAFSNAVALSGITSIGAGESVIFFEADDLAATRQLFIDTWFGGTAPLGLQFGSYSGSGVGLSTGGDAVNLFDAAGNVQASIAFGASPEGPFPTFNNAAGLNNATVTTLSEVGSNGAFAAAGDPAEIGSPGSIGDIIISEVAPWSSGDSPVGGDWFELTNTSAFTIDLAGWKVDDGSQSPIAAVALNGVPTIGAGESVIFIEAEDPAAAVAAFIDTWFGGNLPIGLQIGTYSGSGIGLSTDGDAVNIYNPGNILQATVDFGASPAGPFSTFENAAGINGTISDLSTIGANGAFQAVGQPEPTGSPGRVAGALAITEVAPWSSGDSPLGADWFEVTNDTGAAIDIVGWRMDDSSAAFPDAVELIGINSIGAGESVIFVEGEDAEATRAAFIDLWFGGTAPEGLQIGVYSGSGIGLSTGGDGVNLYDADGVLQASVSFGESPAGPFATFDNSAGQDGIVIANLSVVGVNGAITAAQDEAETGSPGSVGVAVPSVIGFDPADGAADVFANSNIRISFSGPVARGTGTISLLTADGEVVETFDAATSDRLTIDGSDIVIDPTAILFAGVTYQIGVDRGALTVGGQPVTLAAEDYGFTAALVPAGTADDRFQLVTSDGYAGDVAGFGQVFGTSDGLQDITVLDLPGRVAFDGSFAQGGDRIRLSGDAADYTIVRDGSSVEISDGDTVVVLPAGPTGFDIVFADGSRSLSADVAANTISLGSQTVTTTPTAISAAAGDPVSTDPVDPDATAYAALFEDASITVSGELTVFGTVGADTVTILEGARVQLDASFNRGGDTILLDGARDDYSAVQSGSSLILTRDGGEQITIAVGNVGALLVFADEEATLRFDSASGGIALGDEIVGGEAPASAFAAQGAGDAFAAMPIMAADELIAQGLIA